MSLIHWAAVVGHADSLELLLSHGATVSVKTGQVRFAILFVQCGAHIACKIEGLVQFVTGACV